MDHQRRAQYLQALQITQWQSRNNIVPAPVESQEPINKPLPKDPPPEVVIEESKAEPIQQAEVAIDSQVESDFTIAGQGDHKAACMVLGNIAVADEQLPAFNDDEMVLLDNMLKAIGLSFDSIFNVSPLSCLGSALRDPQDDELQQCKDYLLAHIRKIKPKALLVMNQLTAQILLDSQQSLTQLRSKVHDLDTVKVVVTYAPQHLLKRSLDKRKAWQDLKQLKQLLSGG